MADTNEGEFPIFPAARLAELLEKLSKAGISQREVADRAGVPGQYLSDVKHRRRPLTELLSRRLAEEFGFDHTWLLGATALSDHLPLILREKPALASWLPVVRYPIQGDPLRNPKWDGSCVEISTLAVPKLAAAINPYVLRFGHDDVQGRLKKGDLILISQSIDQTAELHSVRYRNKCFLARRDQGKWRRVATGELLPGPSESIGHCLAIVWGPL